jgi:hypothetical protein
MYMHLPKEREPPVGERTCPRFPMTPKLTIIRTDAFYVFID